ncbi:MAG: hypothetical protein A4E30_00167 [Methanomassiliicoccales archaeon PtaB.Bin215]|nr:MAG: hypothetical protein A4E30_00167 [Methanomassiliicoccales archaeon PtaB.Bin215]
MCDVISVHMSGDDDVDQGKGAEEAMMHLGADVLQVAQHGVDPGSSAELMSAYDPDVDMAPCGIGSGFSQVPPAWWDG